MPPYVHVTGDPETTTVNVPPPESKPSVEATVRGPEPRRLAPPAHGRGEGVRAGLERDVVGDDRRVVQVDGRIVRQACRRDPERAEPVVAEVGVEREVAAAEIDGRATVDRDGLCVHREADPGEP